MLLTFRKDIPAAHLDSPAPASQTAPASGSEMEKSVIENILRRGEHFNFFVFSLKTVCDCECVCVLTFHIEIGNLNKPPL